MYKTVVKIDGMLCSMCETHMNDLIRQNCQIKKVQSSAKKGESIIISEKKIDISMLEEKIQGIGYTLVDANCQTYEKKEKQNGTTHLPVYGIGPYYGVGIIILTILGILASSLGYFDFAHFQETEIAFRIIGILACIGGFIVWFMAAFRIDRYIKTNELCTDGIYGVVRNPCYSGIMLLCDGALLIANNLVLLIFPLLYWLAMTILIKKTEEKWLGELYGEKYREYCKQVNRCIPWFSKKR